MIKTKLYTILSSFSKNEIREFVLFVNSPFFTKGKNYPTEKLQKLAAEILKYHKDLQCSELNRQKLFSKIYGHKPFNDSAMRNLFSDLKELAEEYLKISRYRKTIFEQEHNLLIEFFERKLDKEFTGQLKQNYREIEEREKNSEFFYDRHRTSDYEAFYLGRKISLNYKEIQNTYMDFNFFYLIRTLQQIILMVNLGVVSNFKCDIPMYNEVMTHIKENKQKYTDIPRISIYYNLIQMLVKKEERFFYELKRLLKEKYETLDIIDRNNLFICLGNFCLEKISNGIKKYHMEKFENDKEYLASGLIYGKHFFHFSLFMGMAMNALEINEFEWVKMFINENSGKLAPEMENFAINYIQSELNYKMGKFDEALNCLAKINIEDHYNRQLVRNLTLKIYFDMRHFEEASSLAATSVKFLAGKLIMKEEIKQDLKLFIKYYSKLLRIKQQTFPVQPGSEEESLLLNNELRAERSFRNKEWLLQKLKELSSTQAN